MPIAVAQEDEGEGMMPVPLPPRPARPNAPRVEENQIHIPERRDLEVRVREAEAAEARGDFARAGAAWLEVLREEREPESGVQHVVRTAERRWVSYAVFARSRLLAFPEEGRKAFRALADAEARVQLGAALAKLEPAALDAQRAHEGRRELERVWRTYPITSCADEALERLGDLAFEGGDRAQALEAWTRAAKLPGGDLDPKRLAAKIARVEAAASAEGDAGFPPAPARWPVTGGGNAQCVSLPPILALASEPRAKLELPPSDAGRQWGQGQRRATRFDATGMRHEDAFSDVVPAIDRGRIVFATANAINCFDLASGQKRWYQGVWADRDRNSNLYYGVTAAGGRVFASFTRSVSRPEYYRGIPIKEALPFRRLVAFDLATGKRLWDHADSQDRFLANPKLSVALPPIERDGTLYVGAVLAEQTLNCYLLALDAATGALRWRRYIQSGQVEATMFGEHAVEALAMQPCEAEGTVYYVTGFGVAAAVHASSGELQWLKQYDAMPIEAAKSYYAQERDLPWRNSPPLVHRGVLVAAPIDASKAFGLDTQTGEVRWAFEHAQLRRLVGASDGKAVFQGGRIHAYDVRSGKLAMTFPRAGDGVGFGEPETGRGLVAGGAVYVPLSTRIARIDLATGEKLPDLPLTTGVAGSGGLVLVGKDLVTINPSQATIYQAYLATPPATPSREGAGAGAGAASPSSGEVVR